MSTRTTRCRAVIGARSNSSRACISRPAITKASNSASSVASGVTQDRPAALTALDFGMMEALVASMAALAGDESLRVIVVRGTGAHFMAGGDVRAFAQFLADPPQARQAHFGRSIERLHAAIELVQRMPHVVI